jgi:ribonuclease D
VEILYSKTKAESEAIAQKFLGEPIIGFDMEWPWDSHKRNRLQEKVGLIQVACEHKIALFHIGLHPGKTTDDIIAPSLRAIIESPWIVKTGVAVLKADMSRLVKYFDLKPRGAFELSHLHNLITFGGWKPEALTTRFVKLATLVEKHLGLPLSKGAVRTSNWSKPLNQLQMDYAAADAYAGFMLYHRMNSKRAAMRPVPPLPRLADTYLGLNLPKVSALQLQPSEEGGQAIVAEEFFKASVAQKKVQQQSTIVHQPKSTKTEEEVNKPDSPAKAEHRQESVRHVIRKPNGPEDATSRAIFERLKRRRKDLAEAENLATYMVAHNVVLERLAEQRPKDMAALEKIKGIGPRQQEMYGAEWLAIISSVLNGEAHPGPAGDGTPTKTASGDGAIARELAIAASEPFSPIVRAKKRTVPGTTDESATSPSEIRGSPRRKRRSRPTTQQEPPSSPSFGTPAPQSALGQKRRTTSRSSQEVPSSSPAFGTPKHPIPQLHTGLSFAFGQTELDSEEDDMPDEGGLARFYRSSNQSIHRRSNTPEHSRTLVLPADLPTPLTPRTRIFRSKLEAYTKRVASMLQPRPINPLVSASTLDIIVRTPPQTTEELNRIFGITALVRACAHLDKNLLETISKFSSARY